MKGKTEVPNHKSCKKRIKTSAKERLRNRAYRSQLRAAIKAIRTETDKERALPLLRDVTVKLDKAASYGLIHKRNADRSKSRLALFVQKMH